MIQDTENPNGSVRSTKNNAKDQYAEHIDGRLLVGSSGEAKLVQLCKIAEARDSSCWPQAQRDGIVSRIGPNSQEVNCPFREKDTRFSNVMKHSSHSLTFTTLENNRPKRETKSMHESLSLSISLGTSSGNSALPSATENTEGRLEGKASSPFHQGQGSHPISSRSSKTGVAMNLETNKGMISQARNARPPPDGKGINHLISRYWPRITNQELKQLSGEYPLYLIFWSITHLH